ncbi:MAG: nucleotide sugar dehydrogenase [Nanoarchaeota archaeon]|nr:nucleotide sugar dehydrogenase [Nanoarchaeota archaeon]
MKVAVFGLGPVGLSFCFAVGNAGFSVFGVDSNDGVINQLVSDNFPNYERDFKSLFDSLTCSGLLRVGNALSKEELFDVFVICVGTPLNKSNGVFNDGHLISVVSDVSKFIKKNSLVVLRSTVPVKTSRNIVIPLLEKNSGLRVGSDFFFVYAPDRTVQGASLSEFSVVPQIIGGFGSDDINYANSFFSTFSSVLNVSSIESAEMIKLMDNSFRDVVFAYSNELALACEKLGLDAFELINSANKDYSRNNIPFPSPGVGGSCIPKDSHVLAELYSKLGFYDNLVFTGRKVNESVPSRIVSRIKFHLERAGKSVTDAKFFVVGFSFKGHPETSDLRGSTALLVVDELKKYSSNIYGFDPVISKTELSSFGVIGCDSVYEGCENADVVLFLNNHVSYAKLDVSKICFSMRPKSVFFDAWRVFSKENFLNLKDINYLSVGL